MSYELCLEKAGAKVLEFKKFGSYQGDWLAFVEYKGQKGIVQGSYGSCSECDTFAAYSDYDNPENSAPKMLTMALHMIESMKKIF